MWPFCLLPSPTVLGLETGSMRDTCHDRGPDTFLLRLLTVAGEALYISPSNILRYRLYPLFCSFRFRFLVFSSNLFSSPLSHSLRVVVTQIGGHIAAFLFPPLLPTTVRFVPFIFYRDNTSALSSLVDSRRIAIISPPRNPPRATPTTLSPNIRIVCISPNIRTF